MSDLSTNPPAPDHSDAIPLEPLAEGDPSQTSRPRPSLVHPSADKCPNCGASMAADALVCMACGYDVQAGRVLKAETGVDYIEPPPVLPPFVTPGIPPKRLMIGGAVVLLAAMIAAGFHGGPGSPLGTSSVFALLVLYKGILHTGTGLAGLWAAALFVGHRLNALNTAGARMFVAVAVFMLIWSLRLPIPVAFVENGLRVLLGAGGYWLAIFMLFRRSRQETTLVVLFHVGFALFVEMGFEIAVWLQTSVAAKQAL